MDIILPLLVAAIGVLGATRITRNPFRVRYSITETAANTYTQVEIRLPVVALAKGKAQAIELMGVMDQVFQPDVESNQDNATEAGLRRDSGTAAGGYGSQDIIHNRVLREHHAQGAAGETGSGMEETKYTPYHDGDGNGEILFDQSVFAWVVGTGNAAAKNTNGFMQCHLVELDADEVVTQVLADDS